MNIAKMARTNTALARGVVSHVQHFQESFEQFSKCMTVGNGLDPGSFLFFQSFGFVLHHFCSMSIRLHVLS
jgi:hypothetical protein